MVRSDNTYEALRPRTLAAVSGNGGHSDIDNITIGKRLFYNYAQNSIEYIYDTRPTEELFTTLKEKKVDIFTFVQRNFISCEQKYLFHSENESIALLEINSFDDWWSLQIRTEERNRIRKAEKQEVIVKLVQTDDHFFRSAQRIYNETPVRQGRKYTGYGLSLQAVRDKFSDLKQSEILGAYYDGNLIGLLWIVYGDKVARIISFVSLIKYRDKAPNNALLAETVKRCLEKGFRFLVYEKMGYIPTLDSFKFHNGFRKYVIPRYFIPLSQKGLLAMKLHIHKDIQYSLSPRMSNVLLPLYGLATKIIPQDILHRI
jgi:hypothetical protein